MTERWRTGRSVGRTIYRMVGEVASKDDVLIGMMDTPQLAVKVVASVTSCEHVTAERDALKAAIQQARERLDWLIANGFGATTDTLVGLRAALDTPSAPESPREDPIDAIAKAGPAIWDAKHRSVSVASPGNEDTDDAPETTESPCWSRPSQSCTCPDDQWDVVPESPEEGNDQ